MAGSELSCKGKNEDEENLSGFSMQILIDVQKVLCCLQLLELESEGKAVSNAHRLHFKEAAACVDYSSRVTLAMRQSTAWKCLGSFT